MAVAFDAQAFRDYAASTGGTFTHVSVGTPRGIAVLIASNAATTDVITAVSYGGGTLTRIAFMSGGAASEPGAAYLYFKGTAVAASGTVNVVSASATYTAWSVGMTANLNVAALDFAGTATVTSTSLANPSGTVTPAAGSTGLAVGILFSGANAPSSNVPNPGYTALTGSAAGGVDFGSQSASAAQGAILNPVQTFSMGWAQSPADDVAAIVGLIRETPPTILPPDVNFGLVPT